LTKGNLCDIIIKPLVWGIVKRFAHPDAARLILKRLIFMYAVIETGGKQYQVKEGDTIFIEKLNAEGEITFDKVIMVGGDDGVKVGAPYVDGVSVKATLLKNGKGKKITVFTYKPKKSSKRKMGHRQPYSQVRIEAIIA